MRFSEKTRATLETEITIKLNIDGSGKRKISTGIGFFDHMLEQISKQAFIDLDVEARGDLHIDCHHTIEDVGIVFGQCIQEALGNREGLKRYGSSIIPMEESLVLCAIDLSNRPLVCFDCSFTVQKIGDMDTEMVEEFFRAVSLNCGMNVHIKQLSGKNNHHIAEAIFKAFGKALDEATALDERIKGVHSTKGVL